MHDKNYEEYMSSVLGYNINQENTYCSYNYDNFSYDLEKKYPAIIQNFYKFLAAFHQNYSGKILCLLFLLPLLNFV